ncbi:MAG: arachidonate 15-lipoxygenase [Myxococcota bacterium]|jgi:arachidonate 15-lipoxygenase
MSDESSKKPTGPISSVISGLVDRVHDALTEEPLLERVVDTVRDAIGRDDTTYEYAHSYTYTLSDGSPLVAEPFSILKVDDDHPFPEDQGLNFVQIAELAEIAIDLLANLIVKLTNLLNIGGLESEAPEGATEAASMSRKDLALLVSVINDLIGHKSKLSDSSSSAHKERRDGNKRSASASQSLLDKIIDAFKFILEEAVTLILSFAGLYGTAVDIKQFADLFQTIVVPDVLSAWDSDHEFARLRVAGPNPNSIRRVITALPDHFQVTEDGYQGVMGADDSIQQAIDDKRLYTTDYVALSVQEPGSTGGLDKYASAPLALFAVPKGGGALQPVAIQLGQTPSTRNPVFYPTHDETWALAKLHVQVADSNYHELISHLGLTHLLIEPFAVSTHRKLQPDHPLYILLIPHFQGTLFINNAAFAALINPNGVIDRLLTGTIETDWKVSSNALTALNFDAWMLPAELAARGVDGADLPLQYPYRDDAMQLWDAIAQWARNYLAIYYAGDAEVAADAQIQAWVADLTAADGGRVGGLGQCQGDTVGIHTFDYLVQVVTMVIFTASAQHAAVNFPQNTIMSYTPAMPLAAYAPAPIRTEGINPGEGILPTLPPLQRAALGQLILQALGGVYFTRLGDYDRHQRDSYFKDARVVGALEQFQHALEGVERAIGVSNRTRESYTTLLPSRIPQSINI